MASYFSQIRKAMAEGHLPGDRILIIAAKRENTKPTETARETLSADDILREVLSELNTNISKLSSVLDGSAMRSGRATLEHHLQPG